MDATTARRSAEASLLPALERGLDALAEQVRGDVEPAAFFRQVLQLLVHTARMDEAVLWWRTADESWNRHSLQLAAPEGQPTSSLNVTGSPWLESVWSSSSPHLSRLIQAGVERQRVAVPIRQGGAPAGVLEVLCDEASLPLPLNTLASYCTAVADVVGDFLVQHELRYLRRERAEAKLWDQFLSTLLLAHDSQRLATLLSHEGRALTGSDRVSVLRLKQGVPRVVSVSGVDDVDPRSSTVQALERLAGTAVQAERDLWCSEEANCPAEAVAAWSRLQHVAGTRAVGVLLLPCAGERTVGVIVCERFESRTETALWMTRCETLRRVAAGVWSAAVEREAGLWSRLWSRTQRVLSPSERLLRRGIWGITFLAGTAAGLTFVSTELVVTGEGRLWPAERRDIFATANGIVDQVLVQHGTTVQAGTPLLVLRDPLLELEATRVAGELATARARLSVVQAARIGATGEAKDPTLRAQQLTSEEEELRQRIDSLSRQEALLEQERQSWTLRSPINGQVLTWDVEPLLTGRPVQRGEVLLEVANTSGAWVLEMRLRERDAEPVLTAWSQGRNRVPVEFVPVAGQRFVAQGVVQDIARVTEVNDRGENTVRIIAAIDHNELAELRPGKAVLPRLACGRYPLGYVWFRELIDALRRFCWQWR